MNSVQKLNANASIEPARLRISVSPLIGTRSETRDVTWPDLVAWLRDCAAKIVAPRKEDVTLYTLTDAGGGVHDADVRAAYGILLDYDGTTPAERAQALQAAAELGCGFAYSTWSNGTKIDPKRPEATERFRIGLLFDRPLEGADLKHWKAIWTVVANAVGRFHPRKAPGVPESNIGRRWYSPASNPTAPTPCWFVDWPGAPLDLDVLLEAAHEAAPAVAVVDELDLDQSEPVGRAELSRLATSLGRRTSEAHRRVGRALHKMIDGQSFAEVGHRGTMQHQIAGEIARAYPHANADHVAELLRLGLEADGPSTDDFADQLRRQQAAKQAEIAERRALSEAFAGVGAPAKTPSQGTIAALGVEGLKAAADIGLRLDDRGKIAATQANVTTILAAHPEWQGVLAYDELACRVVCTREPPMREQDRPPEPCVGNWDDAHTARLRNWITEKYGFEPGKDATDGAVEVAARRNMFHPVRDYLRGLAWDGTPRLVRLFVDYFGAAPSPYLELVGPKFAISAVVRAMVPGSKVDSMAILEGKQGTGKSTALRTLAVRDEWFADTALDFESKDAAQCLQGKWIYEIGELANFNRSETSRIKAFITTQADNLRPSYGRRNRDFPRAVIFAGTTNGSEYLTDTTGNRRFWPVKCGKIDVAALKRDRDQLWAEAVARYDGGERWWLESDEVTVAEAEQAKREATDPWEARIETFLATPYVPPGETVARTRERFAMGEVLGALGLETREQSQAHATRAGKILAKLGWRRKPTKVEGKVVRLYQKGEE